MSISTILFLLGLNVKGGTTAPVTDPPVNLVAPAVTGTAITTQTLTTTDGSWSNGPILSYTYQWQKGGVNIALATANTYVLQAGDAGANITVIVTATNAIGSTPQVSNTVVPVAADTTPDAFTFVDATGANLSTVTTSAAITVSGINLPAAISVTGGQYNINGGAFGSSPGTVNNGDLVRARGTSSGSYATAVNVAVTIGGVSDTYSITTRAQVGPNAFSFTDQTDLALSTDYISNAIVLAGADTPWAISVTGGQYSINGGAYTSIAGTAAAGDSITVKGTSSGSASTAVNVVLTVGTTSDTYTITTAIAEAAALIGRITVLPTQARRTNIRTFIASLLSGAISGSNIWAKIDCLQVYSAADAQSSLLNWKANSANGSPVSSPGFVADVGYTGDGLASYVNTMYNPTTFAGVYAQNSMHLFGWCNTAALNAGNSFGQFDGTDGATLIPLNTGSVFSVRANQAGSSVGANAGTGVGGFAANRTAAAALQAYRNGSSSHTGVTTSTALNNAVFRVGSLSASFFGTQQWRMFSAGSSLTANEHLDLYNAAAAYIAGL